MPKNKYLESMRKMRQERIKNHECYDCGKKMQKSYTKHSCRDCLDKRRIRALRNKREKEVGITTEKRRYVKSGRYKKKNKKHLPVKMGRPVLGKRWTKKETDFLRKNKDKHTVAEIAKALGRTIEATKGRIKYVGLSKSQGKRKEKSYKDMIGYRNEKISEGQKERWRRLKTKNIEEAPEATEDVIIQIPLILKKEGDNIICPDTPTLVKILGTSSVIQNLHMFKVEKRLNGTYVLPMDSVRERVAKLEEKMISINKQLEVLKQLF